MKYENKETTLAIYKGQLHPIEGSLRSLKIGVADFHKGLNPKPYQARLRWNSSGFIHSPNLCLLISTFKPFAF